MQHTVIEDELHQLTDLHAAVETLAGAYAGLGTQAPPPGLEDIHKEVVHTLQIRMAAYNAMLASEVTSYNQAAFAAGAPTLSPGKPIGIAAPPPID